LIREFDLDLSSAEFRKVASETTEVMVDYFRDIRTASVFPAKTPQEIRTSIYEQLPKRGQDPLKIIREVRSKIIPNSTRLGSPRYFAYVNGSGTMMSCFAEAIAAAINPNLAAWKPAPAATELERLVTRWLAEMIGYDKDALGVLTSGGTEANLTAIAAALCDKADYDIIDEGLQSPNRKGRFLVYMSDHEGHSSIVKAAQLLGLGRQSVRRVSSKADFTMDIDALEEQIKRDLEEGDRPFCAVAQVGSINVGAVDPLEEIAAVCKRYGMWFHADGAIGAFGRIIPGKEALFKGLELADSVTLDPHKWLYVSYECGCLLVKEPGKLHRAFAVPAPYLKEKITTEYSGLDYMDYGPQMSRGFRALKLWMSLKHYGLDGYRRLLQRNVELVEYLDQLVRGSDDFEPLCKPVLNVYSFRYNPGRASSGFPDEEHLNELNEMIVYEMQLSGKAFLTTTSIRGKTAIRVCIANHRTTKRDVQLTFDSMRTVARELQKAPRSIISPHPRRS